MMIKKEDAGGLIILATVIAVIGLFFAFAPKAPEIVYKPVEVTGSAVEVLPWDDTRLQEVKVRASVKTPGFVTIHEGMGPAAGSAVGASDFLEVGEHEEVVIHVPGGVDTSIDYFILMFKDDGDGVYESGVDLPIMTDGTVIKLPFIPVM